MIERVWKRAYGETLRPMTVEDERFRSNMDFLAVFRRTDVRFTWFSRIINAIAPVHPETSRLVQVLWKLQQRAVYAIPNYLVSRRVPGVVSSQTPCTCEHCSRTERPFDADVLTKTIIHGPPQDVFDTRYLTPIDRCLHLTGIYDVLTDWHAVFDADTSDRFAAIAFALLLRHSTHDAPLQRVGQLMHWLHGRATAAWLCLVGAWLEEDEDAWNASVDFWMDVCCNT